MTGILKTPYLNMIKHFMIRLLKNNLFLGNRTQKISDPCIKMCLICGQHIKKRVPLFYFCKKVKELTQFLIRILQKSGFLKYGQEIELFLFKEYKFNTIENFVTYNSLKFYLQTKI